MNEIIKKFKNGRKIQQNKSSGIRKMQTAAGGPIRRIRFTPEQIAEIEKKLNYVPGTNNSTNYRQQGVQAQNYQEQEQAKKEQEIRSRSEIRPVLKRKATTQEKIQGKKDEYEQVPQVIGMSGYDPLLGTALEFYAGGRGLDALGKTGLWGAAKYAPRTQLGNWGRGYFVGNAFKNSFNGTKDLSKQLAFDQFQELTSAPTSKITRLRPEFSQAMQDKDYVFGRQLWSTNLTKDGYTTSQTKHIKVMDTKQADPQIYVTQSQYPLAIENKGLRATHGGQTRPIWLNSNKPYFGTPTGVSNSTNYTYVIDASKFTPEMNLQRSIGGTHYAYPGTGQLPIEGTKRIQWDPVLRQYTSTIFTDASKFKQNEPGLTSLKFFERKPSKLSLAERVGVPKAERSDWLQGNNSILGSYTYEDPSGVGNIDFLKEFFNRQKIQGLEYTYDGLKQSSKNVQIGLPENIKTYLNENTVERNVRAMRKAGYSEREIQMYKDKVNEEMQNVRVGQYSGEDYKTANSEDFGGFFNDSGNFISVNKDAHLKDSKFTPDYVMKHEGRHLIDHRTSMTDELYGKLEKAYDKDFLDIPNHEDAGVLKGYQHMADERVTTNRDARDVLLSSKGKYLQNEHDFLIDSSKRGYSADMVDFQNKIIKYVQPEDIVNAVENSNGYGKRYIKYLREHNKLTPEKIEQFREAMMDVGMGVGVIYGLNINKKKQGGMLQLLKKGSGIHIKEKNKGSFTKWCGGNVTDACIRKGKNSSNPKIRKKATFADNARHFKHKSGGKAFVKGVNVLDSNPDAYKYVKKKYKMHQLGGLIDTPIINYSPIVGRYFSWLQEASDYATKLENWKKEQKLIEQQQKLEQQNRITDNLFGLTNMILNNIGSKKSKITTDNGSPVSTSGTSSLLTNIGNTGWLSNNQNSMNFFGLNN